MTSADYWEICRARAQAELDALAVDVSVPRKQNAVEGVSWQVKEAHG